MTNMSPVTGTPQGGETVTVTGYGFTGLTATVTVGGVAATGETTVSDTSITFVTPASDYGTSRAVVIALDDAATTTFYHNFAFVTEIDSISPATAYSGGGTSITVNGFGFLGDASPDVVVDGVAVDSGDITASVNGTTMTFVAPAHDDGAVDVDVTINGVTETFTLTYSMVAALPGVVGAWEGGDGSASYVTLVSSKVSAWVDQSSAGNNLVQSNATYRPPLVAGPTGSYQALDFNTALAWLQLALPASMNGATEISFGVVMKSIAPYPVISGYLVDIGNNVLTASFLSAFMNASSGAGANGRWNQLFRTVTAGPTHNTPDYIDGKNSTLDYDNDWHTLIVTWDYANNALKFYFDDSLYTHDPVTMEAFDYSGATADKVYLGAFGLAPSNSSQCYVQEFFLAETVIDATDAAAIRSAWRTKYSI